MVKKISFTGGPDTARKILRSCADLIKPAVMELGGKSGNIVFAAADPDNASGVGTNPFEADTISGPVVNRQALECLTEMIERAKDSGARLITGGERIGGSWSAGSTCTSRSSLMSTGLRSWRRTRSSDPSTRSTRSTTMSTPSRLPTARPTDRVLRDRSDIVNLVR